jgi:hypothetical protein
MTPTEIQMTRTQLQTTQPGKNVGVVYLKAESFFFGGGVINFNGGVNFILAETHITN